MSGVLLHLDLAPGAAAVAVIIPLTVQEDVMPAEGAAGLHLPPVPPPAAGLHLAVADPAHTPAATDTLLVAAAVTSVGTREDVPVALHHDAIGHTLAPAVVHPLLIATITEDATGHDQDHHVAEADTVTADLAIIEVNFPDPLLGPSEASQDPDHRKAPLP